MVKLWKLRLGATMVTTALGLMGCASGSGGSSPSASGPSQSVRIRTPFVPIDSLDPITATSPGSMLLAFNVYDSLAVMTKKGVALSLAKSIEPNAIADEWTVTLYDGLTYPDGTAATGQDVLDSLPHFARSPSYATLYSDINFEASSASGSTAILRLKKSASDFLESSLGMFPTIAPESKFTGTGAGPFIVDKGDPGIDHRLHANNKYWDGTPSIPRVTMVPIPDSTTQVSVLCTGEISLATSLDSAALATLSGASNVKVVDTTPGSASTLELALNTRVALFNDSEVRRAAKLAVDRDKPANTILGLIGEVTNDMLGRDYDNYPEDVAQTVVNKEEARHIFVKEEVMSFTIVAAGVIPGMASSAELMAQEFAEVEVQITVDKRDPQAYYSSLEELHQAQAATAFWINRNPITKPRSQIMFDYPFNLSGFISETIQWSLVKTTTTLDAAGQKKSAGETNKETRDQGSDLTWGYQKQVSAY